MNKKMLMLMSNRKDGERGRRVGVEYEDWDARDDMRPDRRTYRTPRMGGYRDYPQYPDTRYEPTYNEPEMDGRYYPPIYEDERRERRMNPIGFSANMNGSDATMPKHNEMERMRGDMSRGYSRIQDAPHFDRQMAEEWAENMENEDGTRGPHWSMEKVKNIMAQRGMSGSPWAFYIALNATYSDLCNVFKKYGINTVDAYVDFAKSFWLEDKDSVPDKLAAYYEYVVEH